MNPSFLGDSYDLVKRFFILELRSLGYTIAIDPMFTGDWIGQVETFHRLLGLTPTHPPVANTMKRCLYLDPDTGLNERGGKKHAKLERISREAEGHDLVFAFDQSFSRRESAREIMQMKMNRLAQHEVHSFYYDSHARFLFVSRNEAALKELQSHLMQTGLPPSRFFRSDANL